jgi:hypothetical protein
MSDERLKVPRRFKRFSGFGLKIFVWSIDIIWADLSLEGNSHLIYN